MGIFQWKPEYSVGVNSMDNDHKKLFAIIDKLHDAAKAGSGEEAIAKIVNELIDYTRYHFNAEEDILRRINYPGLASQEQAHRAFVAKLEEYKAEVDKGQGIFVITKVSNTARDWLAQHIIDIDKQYEGHMKGAGVS